MARYRSIERHSFKGTDMFDLAMIALGCASFAVLILYTYACDRM
jgi:hypothetical protein